MADSVELNSWERFETCVEEMRALSSTQYPWTVFRGTGRCFGNLEPSLIRITRRFGLDCIHARTIELTILSEFKRQAHLYVNTRDLCPDDFHFSWWTLMQHYRAPTRLLDWTESPFAALYFAVESHPTEDGELWAVSLGAINDLMCKRYKADAPLKLLEPPEHFRDPITFVADDDKPRDLFFVRPMKHNARSAAQAGLCSICNHIDADHADVIRELLATYSGPQGFLRRFKIPATLKNDFRLRLVQRNLSARTLFPGIEGLGAGIQDSAWTYADYFGCRLPEIIKNANLQ